MFCQEKSAFLKLFQTLYQNGIKGLVW